MKWTLTILYFFFTIKITIHILSHLYSHLSARLQLVYLSFESQNKSCWEVLTDILIRIRSSLFISLLPVITFLILINSGAGFKEYCGPFVSKAYTDIIWHPINQFPCWSWSELNQNKGFALSENIPCVAWDVSTVLDSKVRAWLEFLIYRVEK